MKRVAQCHCGGVKVTCEGDPAEVFMCSCTLCQRRTGAPVHIGAWFDNDKVSIEGETKAFTRTTGDRGIQATFHFCPTCGTSVWWGRREEGFMAGMTGIAGGCFADPNFPPPTYSVYEKHRHPWIVPPKETERFEESFPPELGMKFMFTPDKGK